MLLSGRGRPQLEVRTHRTSGPLEAPRELCLAAGSPWSTLGNLSPALGTPKAQKGQVTRDIRREEM